MDHDHERIAAVAAGDDTALRELFSRHAPWLAARLRVVLPAADVEDVLQETFLGVWRGGGGDRPGGGGRPATDRMGGRAGGCGGSLGARRPCSCAAEDRESWYCPLLWKRIWGAS